jgi:hypothetical protein
MFKKIFYTSIISGLISTSLMAADVDSDVITYEWLIDYAKKTASTDHVPHFRRLFNTVQVRGLLECGCGYSTKYFLDHSDQVISMEFSTPGTSKFWLNESIRLYGNNPKWTPVVYNADNKDTVFYKACSYVHSQQKDYALIDPSYLQRLDQFFKSQIKAAKKKGNDIDVAFVDPGVYLRGDMVRLLLDNKVPIVVAHGTSTDYGSERTEGTYAWFVVKDNPDYEKIYIPFGQGTTFWISKSLPNVIESISNYRQMITEKMTYEAMTENADYF